MEKEISEEIKRKYCAEGIHFLTQYRGCRCLYLNNAHKIDKVVRKSFKKNGFHCMKSDWAQHKPFGKTVTFILEESSLVVGTSPELNYVTINLHICGGNVKGFMRDMRRFFKPKKVESEKPYIIHRVKEMDNNG